MRVSDFSITVAEESQSRDFAEVIQGWFLWAVFIIYSFLSFGNSSTFAQSYIEITAEIALYSYPTRSDALPAAKLDRVFTMSCTLGTNRWRIDNNFSKNSENSWLFDGTNIFNATMMTKPPSATTLANTAKKGFGVVPFEVAKSNLTVKIDESSDGCPLGDVGVNVPWLAFCSGSYLKREKRLIPLPVAHLRSSPDRFAYADNTQTFPDVLGLPRSVELFTAKKLYEESVSQFSRDNFISSEHSRPYKLPEADGILKFSYTVVESTNFVGWNIPTKFEYFQNERGNEGKWVRRYGGIGRVTSIRTSGEPKSVLASTGRQTIVDRRFRSDSKAFEGLVYEWTNSYTPPKNNPMLQKVFAEQLPDIPPRPAQTSGGGGRSRRSWVIIAIFTLTIAIPLMLKMLRNK